MRNQSTVRPPASRLFERSKSPPPIQIQSRDIEILKAVFKHRYLQVTHVATLLGGSRTNLARRCRLLWLHGFLERPKCQRPTKILTNEITYGLGNAGAALLEHLEPRLHIGYLEWSETPKKQRGWPYMDHQLGIAKFFVALKVACDQAGVSFRWDGHFYRRRHVIHMPGELDKFLPDGFFTLEIAGRGVAHHYLEIDRGNVSLSRMHKRFDAYFRFWRDGVDRRPFKDFRVLTITEDPAYMESLRRCAIQVGREDSNSESWEGLLFSHAEAFSLEYPKRLLEPIFFYADQDDPISLI